MIFPSHDIFCSSESFGMFRSFKKVSIIYELSLFLFTFVFQKTTYSLTCQPNSNYSEYDPKREELVIAEKNKTKKRWINNEKSNRFVIKLIKNSSSKDTYLRCIHSIKTYQRYHDSRFTGRSPLAVIFQAI